MEIVAMIFIGFAAFGIGFICMVPGALVVGGIRFWQVWSSRKFTNQSRVYLVRLAKKFTRNDISTRVVFWILRFCRGVLLFLLAAAQCLLFAILGLFIGGGYGFIWTLFKISSLINNYGEEADFV